MGSPAPLLVPGLPKPWEMLSAAGIQEEKIKSPQGGSVGGRTGRRNGVAAHLMAIRQFQVRVVQQWPGIKSKPEHDLSELCEKDGDDTQSTRLN